MTDRERGAILLLGGHPIEPEGYARSVEGFQAYLNEAGRGLVVNTDAEEMCKAHQRDKAEALGYGRYLVPPVGCYPRGVLLALIFQRMRDAAKAPIVIRNWWRPEDYNSRVGGSRGSSHIRAASLDCDFSSPRYCDAARAIIRPLYESGLFDMGLGLGHATIHFSAFDSADVGEVWTYGDFRRPGWA